MTGKPAMILNVDDNEAVRYAKSRTLRHAGFDVVEAGAGEEAIRKVEAAAPDLILLDIKLPDISGHEVCRRVKAGYPRVMVLQTSASFVTSSDRVIGLEGGADAYLTQPVEPAELVASVRALLRIRAAEDALYDAQERLTFALAGAQMVGWEYDVDSGEVRHTGDVAGLFGETFSQAEFFFDRVHPADRARVRAALDVTVESGIAFREEFRIVLPDGRIRWVLDRGRLLAPADGGKIVAGVIADITERREGEERQRLLAREVDHRAKNALMVVQSILRMSKAANPDDFLEAVEGRVSAMARAHTLLARENWAGGGLKELLAAELGAYLPGDNIAFSGPDVRIVPVGVQPLSLVLHELVTNAAKYGALACQGGKLDVEWSLDGAGDLRLTWEETCPQAAIRPPERRGFGSMLIDGTVRRQLGGEIGRDWRRSGLVCTVTVAASNLERGTPVSRWVANPAGSEPRAALRGRRILLAEDEAIIAMEMEQVLSESGCVVIGPAQTLGLALHLAADEEAIDAAVLDYNLAGRAITPVADLLRKRGVPIVFVTGYERPPPEDAGDHAHWLRKPVAPAELTAALARVLAASN